MHHLPALAGTALLGGVAAYLVRDARKRQLAQAAAVQAAVPPPVTISGFGAAGRGSGAMRPSAPTPPAQRSSVINRTSRPAPPIVPARPLFNAGAQGLLPVSRYGDGSPYATRGWDPISAREAGDAMALANDLSPTGFAPDQWNDEVFAGSYDRPDWDERRYYW
jgi:hypothetical protein